MTIIVIVLTDIIFFMQVVYPASQELTGDCTGFSELVVEPRALLVDGDPINALQSIIALSGPAVIQENFLENEINFSIAEINQMLEKWRDIYFQVSIHS